MLIQSINAVYISGLTSNDWGLYKSFALNLHKNRAFAIEHDFPARVVEHIDALVAALEASPKSIGWKARSVVGERVRWYEFPEETRSGPLKSRYLAEALPLHTSLM